MTCNDVEGFNVRDSRFVQDLRCNQNYHLIVFSPRHKIHFPLTFVIYHQLDGRYKTGGFFVYENADEPHA